MTAALITSTIAILMGAAMIRDLVRARIRGEHACRRPAAARMAGDGMSKYAIVRRGSVL